MLDAADYAPLLARQEKKPELAAGGLDDATAEAIQTRHEPSAFAMRAKLKAQAVPEAPTSASPATDDTKADTGKRENAKASARARGSWSNLLFGGAMLVLFGVGYLAVDLFVAPGVAPARQQNSVAPTVEGQPATDSTQLKAEQGTADPQPGPQTGKSEAATPSPDDKEEPVQVPVPQPAKRPTRDTLTDDLGQGGPLRHLAAISTQALPGTVLQDIPLAANDGAAPPGIDAMPPPGVGTAALRNAAANGDALAQLEVAARFAEGNGVAQDHKLAFAWYERAAMHGLAPAQFRLAAYYERGVGVAVDAERAKIWYRRAAEQGHVRAMHNLAVLVVGNGKDDADYAAAVRWFQQAADRGLTDSQFNLAVLYAHGRGVAKDLAEAYKWFALAARSGDAGAARKLEEMKAQLELPEREAVEQKVAAWRAKPVEPAANSAGR
jgi:localization factor PodJL